MLLTVILMEQETGAITLTVVHPEGLLEHPEEKVFTQTV
jgi:hypothetical protein